MITKLKKVFNVIIIVGGVGQERSWEFISVEGGVLNDPSLAMFL